MTPTPATAALPDRIPFWKMSGSGNDFIVLDNRDGLLPPDAIAPFARRACRRRLAVGADGVVLIGWAGTPAADFRWRYVNADGSEGELCGDAAMCGARFAYLNGIAPATCTFETASGLVRAHVNPDPACDDVAIAIADPGPLHRDLAVLVAGQEHRLHAIRVGVPHAVLVRKDGTSPPPDDFVAWSRDVRRHPVFAPDGTNVDELTVGADGTLRMRTYERGVEDETLACGTGAVACAVVATALGLAAPPVPILTAGGLPLTVDFVWDGAGASRVSLTGSARVVATGAIWREALA